MSLFVKELKGHQHYDKEETHKMIIAHLEKNYSYFIVAMKEAMAYAWTHRVNFPELDYAAFEKICFGLI